MPKSRDVKAIWSDEKQKKWRKNPKYFQAVSTLWKFFTDEKYKTNDEMFRREGYRARCDVCKKFITKAAQKRVTTVLRHITRAKCVDYYRKNLKDFGLMCKCHGIVADISFEESGAILNSINFNRQFNTISDVGSISGFISYRKEIVNKRKKDNERLDRAHIKSIKWSARMYFIFHNIYKGLSLNSQADSAFFNKALQLILLKKESVVRQLIPKRRDVSLNALKDLQKKFLTITKEKIGDRRQNALNVSADGWRSISRTETLGAVFSNSRFYWTKGYDLDGKNGQKTLEQLVKILKDAEIMFSRRVNCLVTDNASANVFARREILKIDEHKHMFAFACHAHQVNLLAKAVYQYYLFDVLDTAHCIAVKARNNDKFTKLLKEEVARIYGKQAPSELKPVFHIRWNTGFECLKSFVLIYRAVLSASKLYRQRFDKKRKSILSKVNLKVIEKFYEAGLVLMPLVEANLICQLESAGLADVVHSYMLIYHGFENIQNQDVRHRLQRNLCYRWYQMDQTPFIFCYLTSCKYMRISRQVVKPFHPERIGGKEVANRDNIYWLEFYSLVKVMAIEKYMATFNPKLLKLKYSRKRQDIEDILGKQFRDFQDYLNIDSNLLKLKKLGIIGKSNLTENQKWRHELSTLFGEEFANFAAFMSDLKPQTADCERLFSVYGFIKSKINHRLSDEKMRVISSLRIFMRRTYKITKKEAHYYSKDKLYFGEWGTKVDSNNDSEETEETSTKVLKTKNFSAWRLGIHPSNDTFYEDEMAELSVSYDSSVSLEEDNSETIYSDDLYNEEEKLQRLEEADEVLSVHSEFNEKELLLIDASGNGNTYGVDLDMSENLRKPLQEHFDNFVDDIQEDAAAVCPRAEYEHEEGKVRFDSLYVRWATIQSLKVNEARPNFCPRVFEVERNKRRTTEEINADNLARNKKREDFILGCLSDESEMEIDSEGSQNDKAYNVNVEEELRPTTPLRNTESQRYSTPRRRSSRKKSAKTPTRIKQPLKRKSHALNLKAAFEGSNDIFNDSPLLKRFMSTSNNIESLPFQLPEQD